MIRPITFEEQVVGSKNDGGVYRNIYPHDGILWGCGMAVTSAQIEIASGMFVLGGRMIWVDGKTVFEVKNPIQNGYARLKAKIDLSAATTQEECGQFATEMEFSTTELFPGLTQEDINSTGKIYEQELAVVKIEAGNVTGIVRKLGNAGIDAEKLGGETPGYYIPQRLENENGTAIKFPDGTMICTKQITQTVDVTRAWGSVFVESTGRGIPIGDFAAPFVEPPIINVTATNDSANSIGVAMNNNTLLTIWRATSSAGLKCKVYVTAIGRWK